MKFFLRIRILFVCTVLLCLTAPQCIWAKAIKKTIKKIDESVSSHYPSITYITDINGDDVNDLIMSSKFFIDRSVDCSEELYAGLSFKTFSLFYPGAFNLDNTVTISLENTQLADDLNIILYIEKTPLYNPSYYCDHYADLSYADYTGRVISGSSFASTNFLRVKIMISGAMHEGYIYYDYIPAPDAMSINIYAGKGSDNALRDMYILEPKYIVYEDQPNIPLANGDLIGSITTTIHNQAIQQLNMLSTFPNPVYEEMFVKIEQASGLYTYSLFNTEGTEVKKGIIVESESIALADLNAGVYFLKVYSGESFVMRKIIKI